MTFFSGFSLKGESELFEAYHDSSDFTVSGFSLGAIEAFEYVCASKNRVDKLQLFSPAFFQEQSAKFKKLQTMFFKKDSDEYCKNFIKNIGLEDTKFFKKGTQSELKELLYYRWNRDKLKELKNRNIDIEVYLGADDKIINSLHIKDFFQEFATIYYIKNRGYML